MGREKAGIGAARFVRGLFRSAGDDVARVAGTSIAKKSGGKIVSAIGKAVKYGTAGGLLMSLLSGGEGGGGQLLGAAAGDGVSSSGILPGLGSADLLTNAGNFRVKSAVDYSSAKFLSSNFAGQSAFTAHNPMSTDILSLLKYIINQIDVLGHKADIQTSLSKSIKQTSTFAAKTSIAAKKIVTSHVKVLPKLFGGLHASIAGVSKRITDLKNTLFNPVKRDSWDTAEKGGTGSGGGFGIDLPNATSGAGILAALGLAGGWLADLVGLGRGKDYFDHPDEKKNDAFANIAAGIQVLEAPMMTWLENNTGAFGRFLQNTRHGVTEGIDHTISQALFGQDTSTLGQIVRGFSDIGYMNAGLGALLGGANYGAISLAGRAPRAAGLINATVNTLRSANNIPSLIFHPGRLRSMIAHPFRTATGIGRNIRSSYVAGRNFATGSGSYVSRLQNLRATNAAIRNGSNPSMFSRMWGRLTGRPANPRVIVPATPKSPSVSSVGAARVTTTTASKSTTVATVASKNGKFSKFVLAGKIAGKIATIIGVLIEAIRVLLKSRAHYIMGNLYTWRLRYGGIFVKTYKKIEDASSWNLFDETSNKEALPLLQRIDESFDSLVSAFREELKSYTDNVWQKSRNKNAKQSFYDGLDYELSQLCYDHCPWSFPELKGLTNSLKLYGGGGIDPVGYSLKQLFRMTSDELFNMYDDSTGERDTFRGEANAVAKSTIMGLYDWTAEYLNLLRNPIGTIFGQKSSTDVSIISEVKIKHNLNSLFNTFKNIICIFFDEIVERTQSIYLKQGEFSDIDDSIASAYEDYVNFNNGTLTSDNVKSEFGRRLLTHDESLFRTDGKVLPMWQTMFNTYRKAENKEKWRKENIRTVSAFQREFLDSSGSRRQANAQRRIQEQWAAQNETARAASSDSGFDAQQSHTLISSVKEKEITEIAIAGMNNVEMGVGAVEKKVDRNQQSLDRILELLRPRRTTQVTKDGTTME